jgi:hypothetical protein
MVGLEVFVLLEVVFYPYFFESFSLLLIPFNEVLQSSLDLLRSLFFLDEITLPCLLLICK